MNWNEKCKGRDNLMPGYEDGDWIEDHFCWKAKQLGLQPEFLEEDWRYRLGFKEQGKCGQKKI